MAVPLTVPIFIPRSSSIKTQLFLQRANLRDKSSPLIQYPLLIPHPLDEFVESDHSDDDLFDDYDDSLYPPNLLSSQCSSLTCYSHNLSFLLPSRSFAISTSQCQPVTVSPQLSSVRSKSTTNLRKALELLQHVAKNQVPKNPNSLISRFNPRFRQITRVQAQLHPLEIDNNDSNTSLITNDDNGSRKNKGEFPVDVSSSSVMSLLAFPSTPKELLATLFCSSEPRDAALTKIHENVAPVELQTWSIKHEHSMIDNPCIPVKPTRNREYRINSRFLLMYAVDCKARMEGYLPATHESSSIAPSPNSQPLAVVARFQAQYDVEKVSNMSRDKLWANVILPARSDTLPALRGAPDFHQYVYVNQEYAEDVKLDTKLSIVKLDGCDYLPWVNLRQQLKSVKPAGAMTRGPTMANGLIPSSGVLKTQFTVKGWSNKRWLPSELDL